MYVENSVARSATRQKIFDLCQTSGAFFRFTPVPFRSRCFDGGSSPGLLQKLFGFGLDFQRFCQQPLQNQPNG
jgi:hypothetical protein